MVGCIGQQPVAQIDNGWRGWTSGSGRQYAEPDRERLCLRSCGSCESRGIEAVFNTISTAFIKSHALTPETGGRSTAKGLRCDPRPHTPMGGDGPRRTGHGHVTGPRGRSELTIREVTHGPSVRSAPSSPSECQLGQFSGCSRLRAVRHCHEKGTNCSCVGAPGG